MILKGYYKKILATLLVCLSMTLTTTSTPVMGGDRSQTFNDVSATYWAYQSIEQLYQAGLTQGCQTNPVKFCPDRSVTRAEVAIFLLRGRKGASYSPPGVGNTTGFVDVPTSHFAAAWIKQLAQEGMTDGCQLSPPKYCPNGMVTRAEAAVFLLRAKHGANYSPPTTGGSTGFNDVPPSHWAAAWIKQLAAEGITSGCGNNQFCPNASVSRAQMAVFLVKTFNLPPVELPDIRVLENHSAYVDASGYLHILGEVVNTTNNNLESIVVVVNLRNKDGELLASYDVDTLLNRVPAGDKACFDLTLQEPAGWDTYIFEPITEWDAGTSLPKLTVSNLATDHDSTYAWFEVSGMVTNNHGRSVNYVRPVGTLYNGAGKVVGCEWTYVAATHLADGATSDFKMPFLGRNFSDVRNYRIQVDGEIQ